LVDLDDHNSVETIWREIHRLHEIRTADPQIRSMIADRLPKLDGQTAAEISQALESTRPRLVQLIFWRQLVEDKPTIGHFLRIAQEVAA
jgi:hypothetical protein